jgi:predicted nucleic-acid-binding protein
MPIIWRIKRPPARRNGSTRPSKEAIFEAVDRFYRAYYLRPKPILRIIKTMLEDKEVLVRRCREGYEFFKSFRQRKEDLAAARSVSSAAAPAGA